MWRIAVLGPTRAAPRTADIGALTSTRSGRSGRRGRHSSSSAHRRRHSAGHRSPPARSGPAPHTMPAPPRRRSPAAIRRGRTRHAVRSRGRRRRSTSPPARCRRRARRAARRCVPSGPGPAAAPPRPAFPGASPTVRAVPAPAGSAKPSTRLSAAVVPAAPAGRARHGSRPRHLRPSAAGGGRGWPGRRAACRRAASRRRSSRRTCRRADRRGEHPSRAGVRAQRALRRGRRGPRRHRLRARRRCGELPCRQSARTSIRVLGPSECRACGVRARDTRTAQTLGCVGAWEDRGGAHATTHPPHRHRRLPGCAGRRELGVPVRPVTDPRAARPHGRRLRWHRRRTGRRATGRGDVRRRDVGRRRRRSPVVSAAIVTRRSRRGSVASGRAGC